MSDRAAYGAPSIGGQVIIGGYDLDPDVVSKCVAAMKDLNDAVEALKLGMGAGWNDLLCWVDALTDPKPTLAVIASQRRRRHR